MTTEQRQAALVRQYCFRCTCSACKHPSAGEEAMVALKCRSCAGPLRLAVATPAGACSLHDLFPGSGSCPR